MDDVFNIMIDEVSEGLIVVDPHGIIKYYNKMAKEIFGIIYNQGMGHYAGSIIQNDIKYTLKYTKSIGNMVVLCGSTGKVKFYQARGYSSRRDAFIHASKTTTCVAEQKV